MKLYTFFVLPFFVAFASAEPLYNKRAADSTAVTWYTGKVTASALLCRKCAQTSCTAVKQYAKGATIKASCAVGGTSVGGNPWWDKTSDGCYVAEHYVSYNVAPPACSVA